MVTGLTYNFLPFMVLPLYASLEKIDLRLIEAGKDLYADGFTSFRKITLPLSMPGLVAGTLLTFIPAAGDYINAELLGTPRQYMIGNVIDSLFLVQLDYPAAAACSVVLMARDRGDGAGLRPPRRDGGAAVTRTGRWLGDHVGDGGRHGRAALHVPADLLRRADVVQRPGQPAVLRVQRLHAGQLADPCAAERHVRARWSRACRSASWPRSARPSSARWSPSRWCGTGSAGGPRPAC